MITVLLYGWLGKRFPREWRLHAPNTRAAMRLIACQTPGFEAAVAGHQAGFKVVMGTSAIERDEWLDAPVENVVKIVPVVRGAGKGKSGIGMIILGAALFFAAPYIAPAFAGFGLTAGTFTQMAFGMVLNGVMSMLTQAEKPVAPAEREAADRRPSYVFDGAVNTVEQGHCVPILYGQLRIGSQIISAGITVEQMAIVAPVAATPTESPPGPSTEEQPVVMYTNVGDGI